MQLGNATVEILPTTNEGEPNSRLLAVASTDLGDTIPSLDGEGYVTAPEISRVQCERALQCAADLLAVLGHSRRSIASAMPAIAFCDCSAGQLAVLNGSRGFRASARLIPGITFSLALDNAELLASLGDRISGVALLAECLSSNHALARFRALVRYFELAFAMSFSRISKKLAQFLEGSGQGHSAGEIRSWVSLRDGAIHGDLQKTPNIVMEADVRPHLARMEQAAYDVLFNKLQWHSPSQERRAMLIFPAVTTNPESCDMAVIQGSDNVELHFQIVDPFGAFVSDLGAALTTPPPAWWWRPKRET